MKRHDAIVVLGCRVEDGGVLSSSAARRARGAFELFEGGVAPMIVTSGGKRWGTTTEAIAIAEQLAAWGVPKQAIQPELSSLTTAENAVYSVALLHRVLSRRPHICVVTCAWHLPRALASFRRLDAEVDGHGVEPPKPARLVGWARVAREAISTRLDRMAHARGGDSSGRYAPRHLGGEKSSW